MRNKPVTSIIFDLDGTLLDTIQDIADSMNYVLVSMGYPPHPVKDYRNFIGKGLEAMVSRVIPEKAGNEKQLKHIIKNFRRIYPLRWFHTRPYGGISSILAYIHKVNITMSVLSNKPHRFTCQMVNKFLGEFSFFRIQGAVDDYPKKPDPSLTLRIVRESKIPCENHLFIGDSPVDILTARNAGMRSVGVTWGFSSKKEIVNAAPDWVISTPIQLLDIISCETDREND